MPANKHRFAAVCSRFCKFCEHASSQNLACMNKLHEHKVTTTVELWLRLAIPATNTAQGPSKPKHVYIARYTLLATVQFDEV